MKEELNLPLRAEVLEIALQLEQAVNHLLSSQLVIEVPKPKAISNQSSSLSFKNKIDLLFDIGIFSKKEHSDFLLAMEFRNQFMHNAACSSFIKAARILDRQKELLRFGEIDPIVGLEAQLLDGYKNLFIHCLDTILLKYSERRQKIEERRSNIQTLVGYGQAVTDIDQQILNAVMNVCMPTHGDTPELVEFKVGIFNVIEKGHYSYDTDERLQLLKLELRRIEQDDEYIKRLFR